MASINDGGPAFPERRIVAWLTGPNYQPQPGYEIVGGMSLRDWFAGQAVAGIMTMVAAGAHNLPEPQGAVGCATEAYRLADAMLAARSLSPKEQQP